MDNVVAIVPARAGSKSIKDKNIIELSGYPLLAYSIAVTTLSKLISRTLVSTNSPLYADVAIHYGAEVPFLRPENISGDKSTDIEFFIHTIEQLKAGGDLPEYLVHLRPTTPLRSPRIVDEAINAIIDNSEATSLRSGHKAPESPLKWLVKDEVGYFSEFGKTNSIDTPSAQPRQSFDDVYVPNGYVDVVKTSQIIETGNLYGDKMVGFETSPCSEVDSMEEFHYIQYQVDHNGSLLLEFLKTNYPT